MNTINDVKEILAANKKCNDRAFDDIERAVEQAEEVKEDENTRL